MNRLVLSKLQDEDDEDEERDNEDSDDEVTSKAMKSDIASVTDSAAEVHII